jgi:hypothetical protein
MFQIPMWNSALLVFGDYKVVAKLTIVYLSTIQWFYFGNLHKFRKYFIRHQRVCLGELFIFNKIATFFLLCYFLLFAAVNLLYQHKCSSTCCINTCDPQLAVSTHVLLNLLYQHMRSSTCFMNTCAPQFALSTHVLLNLLYQHSHVLFNLLYQHMCSSTCFINICAPLLAILFRYSYETDFMKGLAGSFNFLY